MFIAHIRFGARRDGAPATFTVSPTFAEDAQRVGLDVPRHEIALVVLRTDEEVHVRILPGDLEQRAFDLNGGLCVLRTGVVGTNDDRTQHAARHQDNKRAGVFHHRPPSIGT
jgi:hypothetical protein